MDKHFAPFSPFSSTILLTRKIPHKRRIVRAIWFMQRSSRTILFLRSTPQFLYKNKIATIILESEVWSGSSILSPPPLLCFRLPLNDGVCYLFHISNVFSENEKETRGTIQDEMKKCSDEKDVCYK